MKEKKKNMTKGKEVNILTLVTVIYIYAYYIRVYIYIYISVCIYMCVYVCVCVHTRANEKHTDTRCTDQSFAQRLS